MNQLQDALHKIKVAQLQQAVMEKIALWRHFKEGLMAAGTAAGVAAAGIGVSKGYDAIKDRIQKPRAFKGMLGGSPGLKKMDQKAVQMTFNSLYALNPEMAKDPLISASFVERHVGKAEGMSAGAFIDPQTAHLVQKGRPRELESPIMRAFSTAGASSIAESMRSKPGKEDYGREARMHEYKSNLRDDPKGAKYPKY